MVGLDVALGDGDEAREPRLRGEQVVVARIERALPDAEADREQLADRVEQEAEVHRRDQPLGLVGERLQPPDERRPSVPRRAARRSVAGRRARQSVSSALDAVRPGRAATRSRRWLLDRRAGGLRPRRQLASTPCAVLARSPAPLDQRREPCRRRLAPGAPTTRRTWRSARHLRRAGLAMRRQHHRSSPAASRASASASPMPARGGANASG